MAPRTKQTVPCPMGPQCPSGGKHYPDSAVYREHARLAGGNRHRGGREDREEERQRKGNPNRDNTQGYDDEENDEDRYLRKMELRDRPVEEWEGYLRDRFMNKEGIKFSTMEKFSSDQKNNTFTVGYKTGEQLVFEKDPKDETKYIMHKYKGPISDQNHVLSKHVDSDKVEEELDKEDRGNRLQYAGLGAAGLYAWNKKNKPLETEEIPDETISNNPLFRWLNNFFNQAFSVFR